MNPLFYNVAMGAGLACITTGCGMVWGLGPALIVCGACVIGLTLIALKVAG